jgi:sugar phosphate isomerase/epimerase
MTTLSRTNFLRAAAAAAAGALWTTPGEASANPLGLPLGLQPYTVRNDLEADFLGTLRKVAAMGYQEIEVSGGPAYGDFYGHKPAELRKILADVGLHAPSCHFGSPKSDVEWTKNIKDAQALGLEYMVCGTPPGNSTSVEGWKRTADTFNRLAQRCRDAGLQFGYHNHNFEFRFYDGIVGYDQLLRSSNPDLVKMELDCFWMTFAGKDPVQYLHQQPQRFVMLHIKDLKPGYKPNTGEFQGNPFTEVGRGVIDWKRIFEAAKQTGVKHYFVEQDMWDGPSLASAKVSADYLKNLVV